MANRRSSGIRGERDFVRRDLRRLGVRPVKEKGQHFLIDSGVIEEIVRFGDAKPGERLVEIGPGLGALTQALYESGSLTAIEIEPSFCLKLKQKFPKARIIQADVRNVDFSAIGSNLVVFGNLPYAFSTEIVFHLLEHRSSIQRAVLLLQKEFAERMAAPPGGRVYGALSVNCQVSADITLGPVVPGNAFQPPTAVQSQVVALHMLPQPRVPPEEKPWFRKVVEAAFFRRRKKLSNSLTASGLFSKERVIQVLSSLNIDPGRRAETLSLNEFIRLAIALK